jgi:hypothetical protein
MIFTKGKTLLWLLFIVMVSACGKNAAATPTPSPTPTPTPAIVNTPTIIAHPSVTLPQTTSPTQPPTILPTATSGPTFTPSFTPTPSTPEFPAWISDPATNVLLLESYDLPKLILINADTGERYEIDIDDTDNRPGWLWQGSSYYIDVGSEITNGMMNVINVQTGEEEILAIADEGILSADGRHTVHIAHHENLDFVTLVDRETGIETQLSNPLNQPDNREYWVYADVNWSPDGLFLAVEYAKFYNDDSSGGHVLAIYTTSGELFRQYDKMSLAWRDPWSPVSPYRLLYIERGVPCILEVVANQHTCLEVIDDWAGNSSKGNFVWAPDGSKISFIHWNEEATNNGLCYLELINEEIFCPITPSDWQIEARMFPWAHFWSPDGRYLVLFFDSFGLGSDVFGKQGVIVVRSDGRNKQILNPEFRWPHGNPWRPPIAPQAEE